MLTHSLLSGVTTDQPLSRLHVKKRSIYLWWALKPSLFVPSVMVLGLLVGNLSPANAQTFRDATTKRFNAICNAEKSFIPGSNLASLCTQGNNGQTAQNNGSQTVPTS